MGKPVKKVVAIKVSFFSCCIFFDTAREREG